jgi:hypothetical protein
MTPARRAVARCLRAGAAWLFAGAVLLGGCRRQEEIHVQASPASSFEATLPSGFEPVQLRGEGSERLRAPSGASVERTARGFRVRAGADFDIEVVPDAPALGEYAAPPGVSRFTSGHDAVLFESPQGLLSFVVVRELVPEWDDTGRRRFACGSAGGVVSGATLGADKRGFSRAAAQAMVASCRTLELPALE